ncbi:hypothetical protein BH09ACT10_BH09ACT10_16190 [soil metagenome]
MRDVDEAWPAVGAELHHSVGVWPALLNDSTIITAWDPPGSVSFEARGFPLGAASVRLEVVALGAGCNVTMWEDVSSGPAQLVPRPLRQAMVHPRNVESLKRLAFIAERR